MITTVTGFVLFWRRDVSANGQGLTVISVDRDRYVLRMLISCTLEADLDTDTSIPWMKATAVRKTVSLPVRACYSAFVADPADWGYAVMEEAKHGIYDHVWTFTHTFFSPFTSHSSPLNFQLRWLSRRCIMTYDEFPSAWKELLKCNKM